MAETEVRAGQRWRDKDPRGNGRVVTVEKRKAAALRREAEGKDA